MVKILSSAGLLICLLSGISANFLKSALNFQQLKNSAQRTLSKIDNFPEPPNCGIRKTSIATDRIHGGVSVEPHALPWMVYFSMGCGGTLINSRWVLSAAHCFHPEFVNPTILAKTVAFINPVDCAGGSCDSNAMEVEISEKIVHPGFNRSVGHHDIALIQLKDEVKFSDKIQPICLPYNNKASNIFDKDAHVSGWGANERYEDSVHLLKVAVNVWDADRCERKRVAGMPIDRLFQICAGGVVGEDSCFGDSGGPLYMELPTDTGTNKYEPYYQVGVVSFGHHHELCGIDGYPGVYANVSTYIPWIREKILSHE